MSSAVLSRPAPALADRLAGVASSPVRELLALLFPQLAADDVPCGVREVADELTAVRRALRRVLAPVAQATGRPAEALEAAAVAELPAVYDALLEDARATLRDAGLGPLDYLELRDALSLAEPRPGHEARLLVAVWLDGVRLIDNVPVRLAS